MRAVASAIAVTMIAVSSAASQERSGGRSTRLEDARTRASILAFDACVQERFDDVDEGLGITRLVKPGVTPHRFRPENLREDAAVRDLERARLRVVLYLTGRLALQSNVPAVLRARLVKGPVEVTGTGPDADSASPPKSIDLHEYSREAMTAFATKDGYDFVEADWKFVARPVRASKASCLHCHGEYGASYTPIHRDSPSTLRIGDALGGVLYAYRPAR